MALLAIEWGGMSTSQAPVRVSAAVTAAILAPVFLGYEHHFVLAWLAVPVGALAACPWWRVAWPNCRPMPLYGVVYLAPAALCLDLVEGHQSGGLVDADAVRRHLGRRHRRLRRR